MSTPRAFSYTNVSSVRMVITGGLLASPITVSPSGTGTGSLDDDHPITISVHPSDVEGLAGGHGEEG